MPLSRLVSPFLAPVSHLVTPVKLCDHHTSQVTITPALSALYDEAVAFSQQYAAQHGFSSSSAAGAGAAAGGGAGGPASTQAAAGGGGGGGDAAATAAATDAAASSPHT